MKEQQRKPRPDRANYHCPVCGIMASPFITSDNAVDCEDDDGNVQWYHKDCYTKMLGAKS